MEGAEEIERDGVLPYGHVDFGNGRVLNDRSAGAIVEHVEFAKAADGLLNRTLDAILARDVGLDEESVAAGVTNRCFDGSSEFGLQFGNDDARAPSCAKRREAARAMPEPAPVINTTFPSIRAMMHSSASTRRLRGALSRGVSAAL
jgi:hypothetical protein